MRLESKIGKIANSDERIYTFLTDFNNFKNFIPADKLQGWHADENSCRFTINPIGETGVKIMEKEPYKLIKLTGIEENKFNFMFWVQLKQVEENDTRIKLTLEADINPMMQMMAKKPLQEFLDKLVDQLAKYTF
jgi:carbon monoxide dehydrogenase subunit G